MSEFVVDYPSFEEWKSSIESNKTNWEESLTQIDAAVDKLINSSNIEGEGAKAAQLYFNNIHKALKVALADIVEVFSGNAISYYSTYTTCIETGGLAHIEETELKTILDKLITNLAEFVGHDDAVNAALSTVNDIFQTKRPNLDLVGMSHKTIISNINTLIDNIYSVENAHKIADFTYLDGLISAAIVLIDECMAMPADFMKGFTVTSMASLSSFPAFKEAYNLLYQEKMGKQEIYVEAEKAAEEHAAVVKEEVAREKREKWAKVAKIAVGVITVVAIAATAGTGGVLLPAVVGAVTAMASTATEKVVDNWAEDGTLKDMDWSEFGRDVCVAGATGFITGCVGAGVTKGLGGIKVLSSASKSSSFLIRYGAGVVKGSAKNIICGTTDRILDEVEGAIDTGKVDIRRSVYNIFDKDEYVKDIADASIETGVDEAFKGVSKLEMGKNGKTYEHNVLNSDNATARYWGTAAYESSKEVVSGGTTRFVDELIDGNDISGATSEALDIEEIGKDAAKGTTGGFKDVFEGKAVGEELESKDFRSSTLRNELPEKAPNYKSWMKDGGKIYRDSGGKYTYENKQGQTLIFNEDGTANYDRVRKTGEAKDFSNQKWRNYFIKNNLATAN